MGPFRECNARHSIGYKNSCGAIYWTEEDLIDTWNVSLEHLEPDLAYSLKMTTSKYLTFCPLCLTYFLGERPQKYYD
jgi:hypothetical protein